MITSAERFIVCLVTLFVGPGAIAQVVQLPTYRVFGTTGTIVVPDRGSALLGGNISARAGGVSRGDTDVTH